MANPVKRSAGRRCSGRRETATREHVAACQGDVLGGKLVRERADSRSRAGDRLAGNSVAHIGRSICPPWPWWRMKIETGPELAADPSTEQGIGFHDAPHCVCVLHKAA